VAVDPDGLLDAHSPRRSRLVAPLLVAAVLAGVAVAVAFATRAGHHAHPPGSIATGPAADSLPAQRPAICHSAGPWEASTTLLFHTDRRLLNVGIAPNCMNQAGIGRPGNRHAFTQVAGDALSNAALHALGLPPDYGFGTR
jgi:hypothetical protein